MSTNEDVEAKKRALYRLGILCLQQQPPDYVKCNEYLKKLAELDKNFLAASSSIRIAENYYKCGNIDDAILQLAKTEILLQPQDKHIIHFLKAKCYDKQKQFKQAALQYNEAFQLVEDKDDRIRGQIQFRLGWAMVRSKTSIEPGVENLVNAHNLIPDSTELMVKLSAVLFQESGKAEDI